MKRGQPSTEGFIKELEVVVILLHFGMVL